jgi:glucokinase
MALHIGIDVGGTNLRVGVFDGLKLLHQQRFQADFSTLCKQQPEQALERIIDLLAEQISSVLQHYPQVESVGLGFPGFIDPVTQAIIQSPNLPGLHHAAIATPLSSRIQRPVHIENDALCAALAEYHLAQLAPTQSLMYIGLGTGIGGGLIYRGKPLPGDHGVAMEFGHLIVVPDGRLCGCGNHGCVEQYASAGGVVTHYAQVTGQQLSAQQIAQQAQQGDVAAQQAFAEAGRYLAIAMAHAAKIVDIQHWVLGGGVMQAQDWIMPALRQQLEKDLIPVLRGALDIRVSQSDDIAGMLGAALLA